MTEGVAPLTFPMSRESESATRLKAIISDMLPRFFNHHSEEDVLSEYITVLICNGKSQSQARKDLEAFLGEQSSEFVACVWELLLKYFSQVKQGSSASEPNTAVEFGSHDTPIEQGLSFKEHDDYNHKATNATNSMNGNLVAVAVPIEDIEAPVSPQVEKLKILRQVLIDSPCRRVQQKEKEDWNFPGLESSRKTLGSLIVSAIKKPCDMNPDIYEKSVGERSGILKKCPCLPESDLGSQSVSSGGAVSARSHDAASHQENTPHVSVWNRLGKPNSNLVHDEECATLSKFGIEAYKNEVFQQHVPAFPAAYREQNSETIQTEVPASGYRHRVFQSHLAGKPNSGTVTSARPHTSYNLIKKRRYDINNSSSEDFSSVLQYKQAKEDVEKPSLLSKQSTKPDIFSEIKNVKEKMQQLELQLIQSKQLKKPKLEELKRSPQFLPFGTANIPPPCVLQYQQDAKESRIIYVTNVHYAVKKKTLSKLFKQCGAVNDVTIVTDPVTRQPKGTAFVTFATKESVNKAIALSGTMFHTRPIQVWRHVLASDIYEEDAEVCNSGCFESPGRKKGRKRRLGDWEIKTSSDVRKEWEDEQKVCGIIIPNSYGLYESWVKLGQDTHEEQIELLERNEKLSEELNLEKEKNKTLERKLSEMMKQVRMLNGGTKELEKILGAGRRVVNSKKGLGYSKCTTI